MKLILMMNTQKIILVLDYVKLVKEFITEHQNCFRGGKQPVTNEDIEKNIKQI